jgi:hypothetical protein
MLTAVVSLTASKGLKIEAPKEMEQSAQNKCKIIALSPLFL